LAKAKREFALSGFKQKEIVLYYNNSGQINKPVAIEIKRQLSENLGIKLRLEESDRKTFYEKLSEGNFSFWRYGWIADYPDPANFMASFHSKNIEGTSNNSNTAQFSNPEFDQYFDLAMAEVNVEKRMDLLAQAEQVLLNEAAIIPLFHFNSIRLVNPQLMDFPINELELRDYSKAYFSSQKRKNVRIYENIGVE
jgi:ABC-type oligopeptide transport system substrate-binding subunit